VKVEPLSKITVDDFHNQFAFYGIGVMHEANDPASENYFKFYYVTMYLD
jgi:hypothetical protein